MNLSDHDLRQMDEGWLEKLRQVSARILHDLKEARDRLNQTQDNSSRPPSSRAPWEKSQTENKEPAPDKDESEAETPLESGRSEESATECEPTQGEPPTGPCNGLMILDMSISIQKFPRNNIEYFPVAGARLGVPTGPVCAA